jgi:hypothetical protein
MHSTPGVQGIDLGPALLAVLIAHAAGQARGRGEDILRGIVALDPAADVTNCPAQIGPELAFVHANLCWRV